MPGQKHYEELMRYIREFFGDEGNYGMIKKQLEMFTKDYGYTYSGILKSLKYWIEEKRHTVDEFNGHIAIVSSIYGEVKKMYEDKWKVETLNKDKSLDINKTREVHINIPKAQRIKSQIEIDIENFLKEEENK